MKINKKDTISMFLILAFPNLLFAQSFDLFGLAQLIVGIINNTIIYLIFALAVIFFMYHIAKYIYSGNDEAQRSESKTYLLYGIIVLTIMFSIYGVIGLVASTFGITNFGIPQFGK
jgi:hypothetical protein